MFRNKSASVFNFAMVPRADIPRSQFRMNKAYKTTFDGGYLYPMFLEEVLPGDSWRCRATFWARLATPIFPVMDNLHFETFFFFVPCRLLWDKWKRFHGEQANPGDSISFSIPQVVSPVGGFAVGSVYDHFGLPTVGQVGAGNTVSVNALPLRAMNLIFNEWFRDENLQSSQPMSVGDGPDANTSYNLLYRGKRPDYFTTALPFLQKGQAVSIAITGNAPVIPMATQIPVQSQSLTFRQSGSGSLPSADNQPKVTAATGGLISSSTAGGTSVGTGLYPSNLYADLAAVTSSTINSLRQSFQIQKLLERDARGGTRYTEIVRSHFGVVSPDARLQRPEYLGGGSQKVSINPIAQTSATGLTGATTPQGNLSAFGTMLSDQHAFTQSFTEHGYILGFMNVRADITYQQGMRKLWSRLTRYDFYYPVFSMLGEQAISNREIFCDGSANDSAVFGYRPRWDEYRYSPSMITGLMRSTSAGTINQWHYAERFAVLPALNSNFIIDQTKAVLERATAVGAGANGQQLLLDAFFDMIVARPMPVHSVPGLIDHF